MQPTRLPDDERSDDDRDARQREEERSRVGPLACRPAKQLEKTISDDFVGSQFGMWGLKM